MKHFNSCASQRTHPRRRRRNQPRKRLFRRRRRLCLALQAHQNEPSVKCDACATIPSVPRPDDAEDSEDNGDFAPFSNQMKRSLFRRGSRKFSICNNALRAPAYDSRHRTKINLYEPFYSYTYTLRTCLGKWGRDLKKSAKQLRDRNRYATEHVCELQLTVVFLTWVGTQSEVLQYIRAQPTVPPPASEGPYTAAELWCNVFVTQLLTNVPQWSPPGTFGATTPGMALANQMSGADGEKN